MYKFICTGCNVFFPDHFIYIYVFILAVLGLRAACELFSRSATQPAHFSGFSCCRARLRVHGLRQLRNTGSGRTAFGICGPRAPGARPSAAAEHRLWVHGLRQLQGTGSGCTAFGSCGAQAPGARPSAAATRGLGGCGPRALERRLSSCSPQAQLLPVRTHASYIGRWILYHRAIREALVYFLY